MFYIKKNGVLKKISGRIQSLVASAIGFTPPTGMTSTNVQDAVEELADYEDFSSELQKGANVTDIDLYAYRLGKQVVIQGTWSGSFSSTNDTIIEYPSRFIPRANRQIRGAGIVSVAGGTVYNGWYWATTSSHRIGQSATASALGGNFIFTWVI